MTGIGGPRTQREILRMGFFAEEAEELLNQASDMSIDFDKFAVRYYRRFGRVCQVRDYGFERLAEFYLKRSQAAWR